MVLYSDTRHKLYFNMYVNNCLNYPLINLYWSTCIYRYALFTVTAKGWSSDSQLNVILGNVNEDWKAELCHYKNDTVYPDIGMGMILNWNSTTLGPTKLHILLTRQRQSESSSPIAVFFSNDCNPVNWQGVCEHMFEQLPPTSSTNTA